MDGTSFRAEVAISNVSVGGEPAVQVTLRDVTQAWHLQEEVRRVNVALRTLGAVNEALVRAGSEQELMEEVCRIAVDPGGYRAAWVAQPAADDPERLGMVAFHGTSDAELGAVGLDWRQAVRPEGLAAPAHRAGQPVVVNDFARTPGAQPYREAMARVGWVAAAAVALLRAAQAAPSGPVV